MHRTGVRAAGRQQQGDRPSCQTWDVLWNAPPPQVASGGREGGVAGRVASALCVAGEGVAPAPGRAGGRVCAGGGPPVREEARPPVFPLPWATGRQCSFAALDRAPVWSRSEHCCRSGSRAEGVCTRMGVPITLYEHSQ